MPLRRWADLGREGLPGAGRTARLASHAAQRTTGPVWGWGGGRRTGGWARLPQAAWPVWLLGRGLRGLGGWAPLGQGSKWAAPHGAQIEATLPFYREVCRRPRWKGKPGGEDPLTFCPSG